MEGKREDEACGDQLQKKRKIDDVESMSKDFFSDFKMHKILNENAQQKCLFLHGRFGNSAEDAVLILEKTPFSEKTIPAVLNDQTHVKVTMQNDIYKTLEVLPRPENNGIKSTLIYPATEKHLLKYSAKKSVIVNETPIDYQNIVLPYIQSSSFSHQWVYNILDKKSEVERILFEDPSPDSGFILVPDMKWDGRQVEDLYMVAFPHNRSLHSIRSLTADHIPLLENIRDHGLEAIEKKYGVRRCCLRVYLHYVPSYYHLHVHFTHISYDAPGTVVGKAHLLDDVIDNLKLFHDYYQLRTLTYVLRETDELYSRFKEAGKL